MKHFILALFIAVFFFPACSPPKEITRVQGDLMPIRLSLDTSYINLTELFTDTTDLLTIEAPEGLSIKTDSLGGIWIWGQAKYGMDLLHFQFSDRAYDLLLQANLKQNFEYAYPDPEHHFESVALAGELNGWTPSKTPLFYDESKGAWTIQLHMEPGQQAYRVWIDGVEQLDSFNFRKRSNGLGGENSVWVIGDTNEAPFWSAQIEEDNFVLKGSIGASKIIVLADNQAIVEFEENDTEEIEFPLNKLSKIEKGSLRIYGTKKGREYNDQLYPIIKGKLIDKAELLDRSYPHRMLMYFMMLDRFADGNKENNPAFLDSVLNKAQFLGGDLAGLEKKLQEAYFDSLGFNTLWISPISRNPKGAYGLWDKGGVRTKFSAYHGYWPVSFSQIDPRFGTSSDLKSLISSAHAKDFNVILDFVAHHVHEESELYQKHPDWATQLYLPDGSLNTERWDEYRLTTWFDVFLPTLDFKRQEITEAVTDSALFWFNEFELDGLRHDATKHVPLNYWKTLTRKIKTQTKRGKASPVYQIGETYGSRELISSYLGTGLLDAQFDFNLFDAALESFAYPKSKEKEYGAYKSLAESLKQSLRYFGAHHLMGNISGNQDKPRFISLADGSVLPSEDTKLAGYTRDIQRTDSTAFNRLAMMMAFNYAIPGIPIVYYGDEIGMPGANDPDNRRMMDFEANSPSEKALKNTIAQLGKYRKQSLALLYGNTRVLVGDNYMVVIRSYLNHHVATVISHGGGKLNIQWPADLLGKEWTIALSSRASNTAQQIEKESFIVLESQNP